MNLAFREEERDKKLHFLFIYIKDGLCAPWTSRFIRSEGNKDKLCHQRAKIDQATPEIDY